MNSQPPIFNLYVSKQTNNQVSLKRPRDEEDITFTNSNVQSDDYSKKVKFDDTYLNNNTTTTTTVVVVNSDNSVKDHYNENLTRNTKERAESQIYHLRCLNNWLKSCLISKAIQLIKIKKKKNNQYKNSSVIPIDILDFAW